MHKHKTIDIPSGSKLSNLQWTCVIVIPQHCIRFFILFYLIIYHILQSSLSRVPLSFLFMNGNVPELLTVPQAYRLLEDLRRIC